MNYVESERLKYEKVYQFPGYGALGHGLKLAHYMIDRAKGRGILGDFGCGRGGSFPPYLAAGFTILPIDHVAALAPTWLGHPNVLPLVKANLWQGPLPAVDYGLCTDVMEHIPEPHVAETVSTIAGAVKHGCLWSVCHVPDVWGKRIGDRLHMTVQPHAWWHAVFAKAWKTVEVLKTSPGTTLYWTEH